MFEKAVKPLLREGNPYEECRPFAITKLDVTSDFRFSAPLLAWLEITRKCNLRCPHCFVEGGVQRSNELSTPQIEALLLEWADMGVFSVVITGGEPTLHKDFLHIVNFAHKLGFTVGIATNGVSLNSKHLNGMPRDDVIISVSLDGAHEIGSNAQSEFDIITNRLLEIQRAGFHTSIMTTTTRENISQLSQIMKWAMDNDVSLRSVPFVPMGRGSTHPEMINTVADVELAAKFWIAEELWERVHDEKLGLCTGKVFNFLLTISFALRRCMSGRGLCYVESSGDVYPCTTCSGGKIFPGGNVQMLSFKEIWASDVWGIRDITWDNFESTCAGCPINTEEYFCSGRCPGSSNIINGNLNGCGMTDFQMQSVLRREELFRSNVFENPRVVLGDYLRSKEKQA